MMLNGRRFHSLCFLVVLAGASLLARRARADGFVNFDDRARDTIIRNQYYGVGGAGLLFDGDPNTLGGGAHIYQGLVTPHQGSSPNVLISSSLDSEHSGKPLTGTFETPQQTVSLWGGYYRYNADPATRQGRLRAFNKAGVQIASSAQQTVTGNQSTAFFSVSSPDGTPNIYSFALDLGPDVYTTIDDLQFSGGPTMPPPPSPPVVHIVHPPQSGFVDTTDGTSLLVDGTVDGENLLPDLAIELRLLTPPPSPQGDSLPQAVVQQGTLALNGHNFGGQPFSNMMIGVYQLTVTATNAAGEGSATVTFTNLPAPLRQPDFQFGVAAGNCQIARFGNGGKAFFPATGAVIPMTEAMIVKWMAVKNYPILRHDGTLGCPTAADHLIVNFVPPATFQNLGHAQNFERGRIYAMNGTLVYYTPKVFADAIDVMSKYTVSPLINGDGNLDPRTYNDDGTYGINEVGAPGSDPVTYIFGNDPTWLFQRFRRPGFTGEPNTLEVRGPNPNPKLYIERVGGGLVDYKAGIKSENVPGDLTPTVWDVFQCSFNAQDQAWSCPVARHYLKSVSNGGCPGVASEDCANATPMYTTESQIKDDMEFCHHNVPYCVLSHQCPQWSAIPESVDDLGVEHKPINDPSGQNFALGNLIEEGTSSDHVDVQTMGWVTASNNAGTDMSWDHANMQGRRLSGALGDVCTAEITLIGCGNLGQCAAGNSLGDLVCGGWADRLFHVRPLAQWIPDPNADHLRLPDGVPAGPPFWNLLGNQANPANDTYVFNSNALSNPGNAGDMEIEWEAAWGNNFLNAGVVQQPPGTTHQFWGGHLEEPPPPPPHEFDWPKKGSLAVVNGRWMLDCGHVVLTTSHHFHAEIHPINTLINSESAPPPVGMNIPGPVTKAQVWINQLYEGKPFHTKVWAPPRPSPQAELNTMFVNYHGQDTPAEVRNPDGSRVFSFNNYAVGNSPMISPLHSTVTVAPAGDGLSVSVEGPPGTHGIEWYSGQPYYPGDFPDLASGTVGEFIGRWYVGWSCETLKLGNDFVYTCANIPVAP